MKNLPLSLLLSTTGCASAGSVYTNKFVGYRDTGYIRGSQRTALPLRWHVQQLRNVVRGAASAARALRSGVLQPHVDLILADGASSDECRTLLASDFVVVMGREHGVRSLLRMLADPAWSANESVVRRRFAVDWPQASALFDSIGV